jgi:dihydropyrimidinase/dihydroorotase
MLARMTDEQRSAAVDLNIVNGTVVSSTGRARLGVAIKDGRTVGVMDDALLPPAREVIDARGLLVLPGVIDSEAHPGHMFPLKDVVGSESRAAAAGGVTTWGIQHPSPRFGQEPWKPQVEPEDVVSFLKVFDRGRGIWERDSMVDFFFTFQLETDDQANEIPRYVRELGVASFKFHMHLKRMQLGNTTWGAGGIGAGTGFDDGTFFIACERAAESGGMVHFHAENWEIARVLEQRLVAAGRNDMSAWDERSPAFTEAQHVRAYSYFGKITGCPLYLQHTTNALTLHEVVRAREDGITIHSQTGASWLYFTSDVWRQNVPLRPREHVEALWAGLRDGIVNAIGSDHVVARATREQLLAEGVWSRKPTGFTSRVEMLLPLMLHEGVNKGRISIERLVDVSSEGPAKIFGLYPKKGTIMPGSDADIVLVDLDKEVTVRDDMVHTRSGWTLLSGHTIKGWPVTTILRGRVIAEWKSGGYRMEIVGGPRGKYVPQPARDPVERRS